MNLDNRILALIAVGASVSANCQPCLERNVRTARGCGADAAQIAEAIEIGRKVREGAAAKMDKFIADLDGTFATFMGSVETGCGARG